MQMSKEEAKAPRIAILMAIYEPRMDWLEAQLRSLDAQTYPNLRLYIRDDCSPTVSFEAIAACVKECIRAFPFELRRNEKNLGSNGTFERLTLEAEGDYFAYCDQDDIWLPQKLEILEKAIENGQSKKPDLVFGDAQVIDELVITLVRKAFWICLEILIDSKVRLCKGRNLCIHQIEYVHCRCSYDS